MSNHYAPKTFFRQAPNRFLKQYFNARNAFYEVNFDELTETQVEPIYEAWLNLPENIRNEMEQDFQEIDELATEGGSKAILDEAHWHGEDLAQQFSELKGFHEHAFWTFLERPKYWAAAAAFYRADTVPTSYWRKRKNIPSLPANVDPDSIRNFELKLGNFFFAKQGRGKNCKIDCYRRYDSDYFFAYPENYGNASLEWENQQFKRRPHHPAFEVIFVYTQSEGTLDIYLPGGAKVIPDLQAIFADSILKTAIGSDTKDERVYDLNSLRSRYFEFRYGPESGIAQVVIKKLRLSIYGKNDRVILEADPTHHKYAIFDLLARATKEIPQFSITQVGITVTFDRTPSSRKTPTRSFVISWPNSCSLKHDKRDLAIRKMLADSGIEPKEPHKESQPAA